MQGTCQFPHQFKTSILFSYHIFFLKKVHHNNKRFFIFNMSMILPYKNKIKNFTFTVFFLFWVLFITFLLGRLYIVLLSKLITQS
ncbi:hypothetical protein HanIR_Chr15g0739931 [Helianthus annuus]|nr:hypothetical protein HanIR_Chr15g0739931 [Helianthus annuus]